MRNRKGFTLIEVIAVIIIIGVMMLVAVPNVTSYIVGSRKSSFATDVHAYIETIRSEYESREYGPLLRDDEIMLVPIEIVVLEKGDAGKSPFGNYIYSKSYVVIVPERGGYQFYANVVDDAGYGVIQTPYNILNGEAIQKNVTGIQSWNTYNGTNTTYNYNSRLYKWCENRTSKSAKNDSVPILLLCEE